MTTILATSAFMTSAYMIKEADAYKSQGTPAWRYGSATAKIVCGDKLCSEYPSGYEGWKESQSKSSTKSNEVSSLSANQYLKQKQMTQQKMQTHVPHSWQAETGTITSSQDPGLGHESHQLAVILEPSEKLYKGILTYDASEPIQLVALHGPLAEGEDKGQKTWTPDGETKYALTLVDRGDSMGTWMFAGNALAVHTMNSEPFTVSYSVVAGQH